MKLSKREGKRGGAQGAPAPSKGQPFSRVSHRRPIAGLY